jgi:hypothetical protein
MSLLKELEAIFLDAVLFIMKKLHLLWSLQQNKFLNVSVVEKEVMF